MDARNQVWQPLFLATGQDRVGIVPPAPPHWSSPDSKRYRCPMADLQKIVDDLSKLSVLEAAGLAKMLEEKWGGVGGGDRRIMLFEDRERTRKEPLRRGETLFDFYDSCASPGYDELRSVVNGWLAPMPADARNELITR